MDWWIMHVCNKRLLVTYREKPIDVLLFAVLKIAVLMASPVGDNLSEAFNSHVAILLIEHGMQ